MKQLILGGLKTSAVVGTILLSINQYEALLGQQDINWFKAILTYCVPFLVFCYGALSAKNNQNE
tara:strand:- start:161 stop:352 length:192 start_codon:yes stop_codon:yes gene_type:complete